MTVRGTVGRLRLGLLGSARFLIALAVFGAAELLAAGLLGVDRMPPWLVLIATAIVATVFWRTDAGLQHSVDRLVLGEQAGGYEAGRALLQRMATTLPVDEILPALAETTGRTMHSPRAEVRVLLSDGDPWSQVWPEQAVADGSPVMVGVRHAGAAVGEIEVDLTDVNEYDRDRLLLDDLAGPAGLALSTVRLTLELRHRAVELADLTAQLELSNRRIVHARRTEIDRLRSEMLDRVTPHIDRAQTIIDDEIAALAGDSGARSTPGPETATDDPNPDRLHQARTEVADALESLRSLARGIYPPRLADAGLAVSLEGWQQRSGIGVDLQVLGDEDALHRHADVESCVYFSLVTALAALAGPGARPSATVDVGPAAVGALVSGTATSGAGHTAAMLAVRDRVEAFGGRVRPEEPSAAGPESSALQLWVPLVDRTGATDRPIESAP